MQYPSGESKTWHSCIEWSRSGLVTSFDWQSERKLETPSIRSASQFQVSSCGLLSQHHLYPAHLTMKFQSGRFQPWKSTSLRLRSKLPSLQSSSKLPVTLWIGCSLWSRFEYRGAGTLERSLCRESQLRHRMIGLPWSHGIHAGSLPIMASWAKIL